MLPPAVTARQVRAGACEMSSSDRVTDGASPERVPASTKTQARPPAMVAMAKAARQPAKWVRLVRNSVGLLFGFDLHAVFDAAQKSICVVQRQNFLRCKQIQFSQRP